MGTIGFRFKHMEARILCGSHALAVVVSSTFKARTYEPARGGNDEFP
jgi:hypothetical protein